MFYIHQSSCISPQQTLSPVDIDTLHEPVNKQLKAIEPSYDAIPPGVLRRMGKAVRMGVGAALPLLQNDHAPDGMIMGTANGGKEDCVKFLNQIIEYNEGMLTPINFVQSTPNAVAAQVGLLTKNHGYNITHLHLGLAFEYAMIDADMFITETPSNNYLIGAVDDISTYNYYFEDKGGWYKAADINNKYLYDTDTPGSIAGEAAVMFRVDGNRTGAIAKLIAIDTLHSRDENIIQQKLKEFIKNYLPAREKIDLLLSGENGDNRLLKYFTAAETLVGDDATVARFKHMSGEYPTATAMGLWLVCNILQQQSMPAHMLKKQGSTSVYKNVLIYNNYKGIQHSFILISLP